MKTKNPLSLLLSGLIALAAAPADSVRAADGSATGLIEGRVLNVTNGTYIEKARVKVEGTSLEAFTDSAGNYRLARVPAGTAKVKTFFTGLVTQTADVVVSPGQTAVHNIALEGLQRKSSATDGTIRLAEFVVTGSKEMDGAAIAINEQRFAPNAVTVVAADEFGSMAEGNVGEFMKFLPGVTMDIGESGDANTVSINGVPAANVPITVGGFDLASANQFFGSGTGREVNLDQVSLNSIARIEVAYTPTPEITGSALAGSVNMVPRSAFERSKPVFTGSAFIMMRDSEKTFRTTPGPSRVPTRKIHPGFDFSYIVPVNKRFGFTLSGGRSTNYTTEHGSSRDWRGSGFPTTGLTAPTAATQYPDTTVDRPYLTAFSFTLPTKVTTRTSIAATVDFKLAPNDTLSFSIQYANYDSMTNGRHIFFQLQRVEPGDFTPTSTRGTGMLTIQTGDYLSNGTTYMPSLTWRHDGTV
ncbi:MAG: TonB-dependent receptor plug domain-containing protein, partial [Opitutaceae bacterium]|nr:TonB-dependent receptor plug domain-containing protein [Opitutaceae bacterium]